jgi:hypothetical protein
MAQTFEDRATAYVEALAADHEITLTWTRCRESPRAYVDVRHVVVPWPHQPGDAAIAIHEVGHVACWPDCYREGERGNRTYFEDWQMEARVSEWALGRYAESGLPGLDMAQFVLGRYLLWYLRDAQVSREVAEQTIPAELLPYRELLAA